MMEARTVEIFVDCPPHMVYEYVFNPENLPEWAGGLALSVRRAGREWRVGTPQGPATLRFAPRNNLGVLDHYVTPLRGPELLVPMRVVPNGYGSEVSLTLFRREGVTPKAFLDDEAAVRRDLGNLKAILERLHAAVPGMPRK